MSIYELPNEIILMIFNYTESVFEIMQVSTYWYELIKSEKKILITSQLKKLLHQTPKIEYLLRVRDLIRKNQIKKASFLLTHMTPSKPYQLTHVHFILRELYARHLNFLEKKNETNFIDFFTNTGGADNTTNNEEDTVIKDMFVLIGNKFELDNKTIKKILKDNKLYFGSTDIMAWKFLISQYS